MEHLLLAIDPGRQKCGVAVVAQGSVLMHAVVSRDGLAETLRSLRGRFGIAEVVVGDRTGAGEVAAVLRRELAGVRVTLMNEAGTTLEARRLYFAEHPRRGWRRLIPLTLQVPPEPYDDYSAIVLARRRAAQGLPAKLHGTSSEEEESPQGRSIANSTGEASRGPGTR